MVRADFAPTFRRDAVVGDDVEFFDVVVGLAGHHRVNAARVVADHAAEGATVVAGGVGAEGQMIFFRGVAEMVENNSGLHACDAAPGIDLKDLRHVLREIEDDGDIAALSGERCAATAAEQRRAEFAADSDRGDHVVGIARKNDADRDLAVVRSVGGVESAAADCRSERHREAARAGLRPVPRRSVERGLWESERMSATLIVHWACDLLGSSFLGYVA